MNLNPANVLDPVFHFLDGLLDQYGVYFYLAFVWLSLLVLACSIQWRVAPEISESTARERRPRHGLSVTYTSPPPTIIIHEYDPTDDGLD